MNTFIERYMQHPFMTIFSVFFAILVGLAWTNLIALTILTPTWLMVTIALITLPDVMFIAFSSHWLVMEHFIGGLFTWKIRQSVMGRA